MISIFEQRGFRVDRNLRERIVELARRLATIEGVPDSVLPGHLTAG